MNWNHLHVLLLLCLNYMNMSGGFIWKYDMKTVLRQYNIEKNKTCITGTVHLFHESYDC